MFSVSAHCAVVRSTSWLPQRVEAYTLQKAANLVMNVDGCIGALFLDLLHSSSMFTEVSVVHHHSHCNKQSSEPAPWVGFCCDMDTNFCNRTG